MKKIIYSIICSLIITNSIQASDSEGLTQTIRGVVIDTDSKIPVIGATIIINDSDPLIGTVTDLSGNFVLKNVNVGRVSITVSSIGYEEKFINNLLIGSGRELQLDIELKESLIKIEEVVVSQKKHKSEILNEMALLSARAFSIEETERYAGTFNDPARMVSAFAGVSNDPHGDNSIVVRGNSSKGIQWRLEGVEIPNPNHFADEGMTGGPINALNSDMLANSDFYTGAFAPEYGNAFSGIFDMRMRTGNVEKNEYSISLSTLGLDATVEGPLKTGINSSFLANYRYSSLGLLDDLGIVDFGGVPRYQDLSFKFKVPTRRLGSFTWFGLGGVSSISESIYDKSTVTDFMEYGSKLGITGINHTYFFNDRVFLKSFATVTTNVSTYIEKNISQEEEILKWNEEDKWTNISYKLATKLNVKYNAKHRIQLGLEYTLKEYSFLSEYMNEDYNRRETFLDKNGNAGLLQSFVSWKYRLNEDLTIVSGIHAMQFELSDEVSIEPRVGMKWQFRPKHSINAGFGIHSKNDPLPTYYATRTEYDSINGELVVTRSNPNLNLELPKAQHYVLGYDYRIGKNMHAKIELYYQHLYNIAIGTGEDSLYSLLTFDGIWSDVPLVNKGKGRNYGIEFTLERYFVDDYYFMITGSLYESKYTDINGVERNTTFAGNYNANVLLGKEFKIGKPEKNRTLAINTKATLLGGRRTVPIDLEKSIEKGESVRDYSKAWESKIDDIFQLNLGITLRRNREKTAHELKLDLQNVTFNEARIYDYYDSATQSIDYSTQLGFIPNIVYRIEF